MGVDVLEHVRGYVWEGGGGGHMMIVIALCDVSWSSLARLPSPTNIHTRRRSRRLGLG